MTPEELRRLAADRPLRTREIHPPNAFYGHAELLRRYAGLAERRPLKAVVEHGIAPLRAIWQQDLDAPLPTFLCAGPERAALYTSKASADRVAVPIGPLVRYAEPEPPRDAWSGGTLVFPAHSTHHVRVEYDAAAFVERILGDSGRLGDVTVCLYWRDVLRGADRPYRERGLRCVTAGHMFDQGFLPRLRGLIESADRVMTNRFGSHVAYGVALHRPTWISAQDVEVSAPKAAIRRDGVDLPEYDLRTRRIYEAFAEPADSVTAEQQAALQPMTGLDRLLSPGELASVLGEAEERYRRSTGPAQRISHHARRHVREALRGVRQPTRRATARG